MISYAFGINSWSLFQVQSYLFLSIVNYGVSKHYAGSQVSDRSPLGYLFYLNTLLEACKTLSTLSWLTDSSILYDLNAYSTF